MLKAIKKMTIIGASVGVSAVDLIRSIKIFGGYEKKTLNQLWKSNKKR
ncbi:hypothetical protein ACWG0P_07165 [Amedibacillus sp. YH-ame6]